MSRDSMRLVGQKTKLKVLEVVAKTPEGISAKDVAAASGLNHSTVRLHLAKAKKSRLVSAEKKGRSVLYAPAANKTAQAAFAKMGVVTQPAPTT